MQVRTRIGIYKTLRKHGRPVLFSLGYARRSILK